MSGADLLAPSPAPDQELQKADRSAREKPDQLSAVGENSGLYLTHLAILHHACVALIKL